MLMEGSKVDEAEEVEQQEEAEEVAEGCDCKGKCKKRRRGG